MRKDLEDLINKTYNKYMKCTKYQNWIQTRILLSEFEKQRDIINEAIKYCEESSKTIKSEYFSDVLKILKGED